jgi:hypothetical protein
MPDAGADLQAAEDLIGGLPGMDPSARTHALEQAASLLESALADDRG